MIQLVEFKGFMLDELAAAARLDNHSFDFPTHVLTKEGRIVGGVSFLGTPNVDVWFSTLDMNPRDTRNALKAIDLLAAKLNIPSVVVPVAKGSPLEKILTEDRGFHHIGEFTHYQKLFPHARSAAL